MGARLSSRQGRRKLLKGAGALVMWLAYLPLRAADLRASGTGFELRFLPSLGGGFSIAYGINDLGTVVGSSLDQLDGFVHAVKWEGPNVIDLGTVGGNYTAAVGISSTGLVAGWGETGTAASPRAVVWEGTKPRILSPRLPTRSQAFALNSFGQVAGYVDNPGRAAVWTGRQVSFLRGPRGASDTAAYGINDRGQIVGMNWGPSGLIAKATFWENGAGVDLPGLGGGNSVALSINNLGQIVGSSEYSPGSRARHATVWINGSATDLGTLGGLESSANCINDDGVVVGTARVVGDQTTHAAMWSGGAIADLNDFLDPVFAAEGWVIWNASSINSRGEIVGQAYNPGTAESRAFMLTPSVSR